jgi:hypothetical protein
MSKIPLTVFLCTDKDCAKAWRRVCDDAPRKWLKKRLAEIGVPARVRVVRTECMDHCEEAACLQLVCEGRARLETHFLAHHDLARLFEAALDVLDVPWRLTGDGKGELELGNK